MFMSNEMENRKRGLVALLHINGHDSLAEQVDSMTEEEFNNMNEAANGVLELRVKAAEAFGNQVLKMLTEATGREKSMIPGMVLLNVAEGVRGSMVMSGMPVGHDDIVAHVINAELMDCVISTLELSVPDQSGQKA